MGAVYFSLDIHLVECIKKVLPLPIFFETGTFKGDTVDLMLPYFDRLITAELSEPLWEEVTKRFSGEKKVEPYLGNSSGVIAKLRPTLEKASVLYWLDAHWCVADNTLGEKSQCPLLEEIYAIGQLNGESIILIDDARLFLASPLVPHEISHWPSIDSIFNALKQISSQHKLVVVNDVIIYYPKNISENIIGYARKHGVDWLIASQSYAENIKLRDKNIELRGMLDEKQIELNNMYASTSSLLAQCHEKDALICHLTDTVGSLQNVCEERLALIQLLDEAVTYLRNGSEKSDASNHQNGIKNEELYSIFCKNRNLRNKYNFFSEARNFYLRIINRIRAIFRVRLGVLRQHPPVPLALYAYKNLGIAKRAPLKISIVTPCRNHAAFIERTMKSILDQKYPDLEYFVQDGDSGDGTKEILQKYSNLLTGWESIADGGQSHAINMGLRKTTGEIMAWLNSDDILLPGALAYVSDYFRSHPDVDVIYGHRILIDENDQQIGRWMLPPHNNEALSWSDFIPQETLFWRRRIWDKVGSQIDESFQFAMDWDLLIRFREAGASFACVPRFIGGFRIHSQQKTSANIGDIGIKEMNRIRERVLGFVPRDQEVNQALLPFLRRHVLTDLWWRIRNKLGMSLCK